MKFNVNNFKGNRLIGQTTIRVEIHPSMLFNRPGPCSDCGLPGWDGITDPDYPYASGTGVNPFGRCLGCQEVVNAEVAAAEAEAGWDPNP